VDRLVLRVFPILLLASVAAILNRKLYRLEVDVLRARELGSYQLEERIGSGGMGEVWRARHRMLCRTAAVKLIRNEVLLSHTGRVASMMRRRFEQEAHATASLRSPHTVKLFDFGLAEDGSFYYVMELLDGLDLESLVTRFGPQPPARVAHLMLQACDSLAEAHQRGLIHRDIKPTNLFVSRLGLHRDFLKILDFGLVKNILRDGETRMTGEGFTTGTPAYMAPEVALGKPDLDARADLYSVGCVAYWLLTGCLVFEERSPVAMMMSHIQKEPEPPSQRTEVTVPASLERVILACLAKAPEDRPPSAEAVALMLAECQDVGIWGRQEAERWWQINMPLESVEPEPCHVSPATSL
jgi:serine/threonine-protein kinase